MNLKLVVTTMIVAGAITSNAFAEQADLSTQVAALQTQVKQMQDAIGNNASVKATSANWFNRISVSGLANIDLMGSHKYAPVGFETKNPSAIAISSAALFIDANVSDWTKAHISFAYATQNQNSFNPIRPGAYTYGSFNAGSARLNIDETYVTIGNFAKSPFYMTAGKQYVPFGSYTPFSDITPSTTQLLSQVNDPAIVAGFVTNNGFNGSIFALQGIQNVNTQRNNIQNYGASLALNNTYSNVSYNAGVSYLANMADITTEAVNLTNDETYPGNQGYTSSTPALAANVSLKYNNFDASGKWVGATKKFNVNDFQYDGTGAKPSAWSADWGYSFPVLAHDSRFGLGYQASKQANDNGLVNMPKTRYLIDYKVNVSKYTDLGFELRHDVDYSVANGGTGNNTNTGVARLSVKFA